MEQLPENSAEPGRRSAVPPVSLGGMLRQARERLGLSVADVAAQIKFAPRQIEALEADDFKQLPEAAFLRGFVRSYAKILHLDGQALLAALPQTKTAAAELTPTSVEVPFPVAHSGQKQNLILFGAALLLAVVVAGFALRHFTVHKQAVISKIETPVVLPAETQAVPAPQNTDTSPVDEPKLQASESVEKAPERTSESDTVQTEPQVQTVDDSGAGNNAATPVVALRLVFDDESWTEITDKNGKIVSSQVNPGGSELNVKGHLPLSLVIGHASTTHLYQDGTLVDLAPYTHSSSDVARLTLE